MPLRLEGSLVEGVCAIAPVAGVDAPSEAVSGETPAGGGWTGSVEGEEAFDFSSDLTSLAEAGDPGNRARSVEGSFKSMILFGF